MLPLQLPATHQFTTHHSHTPLRRCVGLHLWRALWKWITRFLMPLSLIILFVWALGTELLMIVDNVSRELESSSARASGPSQLGPLEEGPAYRATTEVPVPWPREKAPAAAEWAAAEAAEEAAVEPAAEGAAVEPAAEGAAVEPDTEPASSAAPAVVWPRDPGVARAEWDAVQDDDRPGQPGLNTAKRKTKPFSEVKGRWAATEPKKNKDAAKEPNDKATTKTEHPRSPVGPWHILLATS